MIAKIEIIKINIWKNIMYFPIYFRFPFKKNFSNSSWWSAASEKPEKVKLKDKEKEHDKKKQKRKNNNQSKKNKLD